MAKTVQRQEKKQDSKSRKPASSSSYSSSTSSGEVREQRCEIMLECQLLSFSAFVKAWKKEQTRLSEPEFTLQQLKTRWANLRTSAFPLRN